MYRFVGNVLQAFLILGIGLGVGFAAEEATLTVRVVGASSDTGEVAIAAYPDARSYKARRDAAASDRAPVQAGTASLKLTLPLARYALLAYHDVNGNRELDMDERGRPSEPVAFSGQPRRRGQPPGFRDAGFDLPAEGLTVQLELRGP